MCFVVVFCNKYPCCCNWNNRLIKNWLIPLKISVWFRLAKWNRSSTLLGIYEKLEQKALIDFRGRSQITFAERGEGRLVAI